MIDNTKSVEDMLTGDTASELFTCLINSPETNESQMAVFLSVLLDREDELTGDSENLIIVKLMTYIERDELTSRLLTLIHAVDLGLFTCKDWVEHCAGETPDQADSFENALKHAMSELKKTFCL